MKDHLLALEIKDPVRHPAGMPVKKDGSDPSGGSGPATFRTVSALVLKPSVKGLGVVAAVTLHCDVSPDTDAEDSVCHGFSMDEILEQLGKKINISNCSRAVVAVPASMASHRHMDLPFRSRRKIRQVLPMELNAMLPITDEAHASDFVYTGVSVPGNYTFFAASLSRSLLDALCVPLEKQGIKPVMVAPAGYLAAHFFLDTLPPGGFCLMVAVCPHCLVINGVLDGTIVWLRSIARSDDVSLTAVDVGRTLVVFQQRLGIDVPVLACHLIWCDTRQEALETHLENALAVPVLCTDTAPVADALGIGGGEKDSLVSGTSPFEYINAFAAARCMGKPACLDFCRTSHGQGAFVEKYMAHLVTMGLLLLICFCMAVAGEYMEIRDLKTQSAAMDHQARLIFKETFPEITTIVDPYMQMKVQVRQALAKSGQSLDMDTRFAGNTRVMDLFFGLSSRIPDTIDVEISRLVWNEGRMVLSGNTDTYDSVDKMKTAIEASPWFTDVKISNAAADKTDNRIRFKFIFQTVNPDDKAPTGREGNA